MPTDQQLELSMMEHLTEAFGTLHFTIIEWLQDAAQQTPERAAILEPDRDSTTYSRLLQLVGKTVATLNQRGFTSSSRIGLVLPTTGEGAAVYLSVMAGMTVVPLNPTHHYEEFERLFKHLRVDAVLVEQGKTPPAYAAAEHLGLPIIEVVKDFSAPAGTFEIAGANVEAAVEPRFAGPDDLALVLSTSGTTELPKLVPWPQKQLALRMYTSRLLSDINQEVAVNIAPFYHASGLFTLLLAIQGMQGIVCIPTFNPSQIYRYLVLYQVKLFFGVPAMLQALLHEAENHKEEIAQLQLEQIVVSSVALPEPLFHALQQRFGVKIQITYGLTEISITNTFQNAKDTSYKAGSVGKPFPFCKVVIADDSGNSLPSGEAGEILVRSPLLFKGYENDPEATAEAFRGGWFHTGDVGYLDDEGFLFLVGRVKEMINRGGSKVSPEEVDAVLMQHPGVAAAAAFGFPHSALGEDVAAAIITKDPALTERELRRFAADHLATYKVPSRFIFVEEIPRTPLGKVKRLELAEQHKATLKR